MKFQENGDKIIDCNRKEKEDKRLDKENLNGIPEEEIAIFLINGRHSKLHTALEDNSVLALFPPVGGG